MLQDGLVVIPERKPIEFFEETIFIRGCRFSLMDIREFYLELSNINQEFGQGIVAELQ